MPELSLPHNWEPRPYQLSLWDYLRDGGTRAIAVYHRRAGKDELCLRWMSVAVMRRPATYWYCLPESSQARKSIWLALNPHTGRRRIREAFPAEIIKRELENEMMIEFINGSTLQLVGSDNYNSLVGSPPVGIVFSEYALADPAAWSYMRPILAENGGWALFISTPRGRNHLYTLLEEHRDDPAWFCEVLPASKTGVFTSETLNTEKRELIAEYGIDQGEALFEQEYNCSFQSAISGSYYGRVLEQLDRDQHLTRVPYNPKLPVHTAWDLGFSDSTAIIFVQLVGQEIHVIDYVENNGVGLDWYVRELKTRPYVYGEHILPHDCNVRELGTGRSRWETLRSLGINARVLPNQSLMDGINAVRTILPMCWFDATKTKRLVEALRQYGRSWNDKTKSFAEHPAHTWASHPADAMRYFAISNIRNAVKRPIRYSNVGII